MCGDKNLFFDPNDDIRHDVKLRNKIFMVVLGKGSIKLTLSGITHVVREVYFASELETIFLVLVN